MAVELATDTFVAPRARVVGDVRMASESSLWYGALLDGQAGPVTISEQANVQDNAIVQGRPGQAAFIGAGCTLGHNARVFGAHVEERSLIAIGATVLAGARIGRQSIVAANATVPEGMQVPPRSLVVGNGRILREVSEAEIDRIDGGTREYVRLAAEHRATLAR
ncbi:MAG: gamma carbonic anhydrase family protein [Chloroflexota bacterium]|nr:gamma carbonic anhydrase family protein [Chloroflexota bacterium]